MTLRCASLMSTTRKKSSAAWPWSKKRAAAMASYSAFTQMARRKSSLLTVSREKCGLTATRLFGSQTKTSNRLTAKERQFISSLRHELRRRLTLMVYKFSSSRMNRSRSISQTETKRSTFQMARSSACLLMEARKASSQMAQSKESIKLVCA